METRNFILDEPGCPHRRWRVCGALLRRLQDVSLGTTDGIASQLRALKTLWYTESHEAASQGCRTGHANGDWTIARRQSPEPKSTPSEKTHFRYRSGLERFVFACQAIITRSR